MFEWLWLVASGGCLFVVGEKILLAGWWLELIWCERKTLLASWLRVYFCYKKYSYTIKNEKGVMLVTHWNLRA